MLFYRFVLHAYVEDTFDRQLLGLSRTLGASLSLLGYLLAVSLPSFLLARRDPYHPVWSGLECLTVYAATAAVTGSICAAFADDGWRALGALVAGGDPWAAIGSLAMLGAAFLAGGFIGSGGKTSRVRATGRGRARTRRGEEG